MTEHMTRKRSKHSKKQKAWDEECHRKTVVKLLVCKACKRPDWLPTAVETQKAIDQLKDVVEWGELSDCSVDTNP